MQIENWMNETDIVCVQDLKDGDVFTVNTFQWYQVTGEVERTFDYIVVPTIPLNPDPEFIEFTGYGKACFGWRQNVRIRRENRNSV